MKRTTTDRALRVMAFMLRRPSVISGGTAMKSDAEIQRDVREELSWDPRVDVTEVGITVRDGAVALAGRVSAYGEKLAAVRAAERVHGVRAVADELEVQLSPSSVRDDSDVATSIAHVIDYNTALPEGAIKARVDDGYVTLEGEVEWPYQREAAEKAIRHITGVRGVANLVSVRRRATAVEVDQAISAAFARNAVLDARSVRAEVREGRVDLYGHVHSLYEQRMAQRAAEAAPGVTSVQSHIEISP
jgi:osmotically-inducible protein OsmY